MTIRVLLSALIFSAINLFTTDRLAEGRSTPKRLNGSFVLVSERTVIADRNGIKSTIRQPPEWVGVYIFKDGVFNRSMVSAVRQDSWVGQFPKDAVELGFESETGTYQISGSELQLTTNIALHPFAYHRNVTQKVEFDGDTVTLTTRTPVHSKWVPAGDIITVLKKAPSSVIASL